MKLVIQIVMITAAAFIIIFCKADPKKAVAGPVWQSGMVAVVAIYGIAWLADTFFANHLTELQAALNDIVASYPWSIALVFFAVSVLINSQGAVVVAMLPLAYSLGISGVVLLGVLPTFAIVNEYTSATTGDSVYHFDFYRIRKIEEVYDMGYEEYFYSGCLCFLEWPELIEELLPDDATRVTITEQTDGSRLVEF